VPYAYLHVFVELVGDVLSWGPAAEVLVLHLLDPLNCVFGDCVEGTHHAAVCEDVSLRILSDTCASDHLVVNSL
jgi:hypothetical protein